MIFSVLALVATANALYFTLEPSKEMCFNVNVPTDKKFYGYYVISGKGEENVITRVSNPMGRIEYMSPRKSKEGKFQGVAKDAGMHALCFRTIDKESKVVSFEFGLDEDGPSEDHLAKDSSIDPLSNSLRSLSKQLDSVYRNVHFYQRREKVHRDLTEQTCDRVVASAIVKMIVLAVVGFLQVYILRGFFTGNQTAGKPV